VSAVPGAVSGGAYDYSWVNLDGGPLGSSRSNAGTGTVASGKATTATGNSTSFGSNWSSTDSPIEPASGTNPNPLVAQILVLHGDGVTFTGSYTPDSSATLEATTFSYGSVTTTTPPPTGKIISLVATGTTPTGYGSAPLGTLTVQNAGGPGKYFPGYFNIPGGAATGYVAVTGFLANDYPEVYALQVDVNGVLATSSQVATIIADIAADDSGVASVTTVAGSPYASLFNGYQILITDTTVDPYFAFDFSSASDTDSALGAVTVTSIAAVPEPATAAGVILGAAGLLLGRRKNRVQTV